jgi:P pilus assembly protein, porin PapC
MCFWVIKVPNKISASGVKFDVSKPSVITIAFGLLILNLSKGVAREYFNPQFLESGVASSTQTDLSSFESGAQLPGQYRVDILINDEHIDTQNIEFNLQKQRNGNEVLVPCFTLADLNTLGIKTDVYHGLAESSQGACADISAIPDAKAIFIFEQQRLKLSIPQVALATPVRGYISPDKWDEGITALTLNYDFSGMNTASRNRSGTDNSSQYVNLRPGVNLGPWRLRNYSTWNKDDTGKNQWQSVYNYLSRDVKSLKSNVTFGDSNSLADVFDSVPFRGVQLASDDDMLPDSQRGYAPTVRGIARTTAQVIVRQGGYIISQTTVAPGAFELNDMNATGGSGDMDVTIKEADGSEQHIIVPYASLPVLQREGRFKYSLTGGQYRPYSDQTKKNTFLQGTITYGLPWGLTLYGGMQNAGNKYQSVALGMGANLAGLGALSLDGIQAHAQRKSQPDADSGQSWRVRYSKNVNATGTNFSIAGYRYSSKGFYTLAETLDTYSSELDGEYSGANRPDNSEMPSYDSSTGHTQRRQELSLSQNIEIGYLSLSVVNEDDWDGNRTSSLGLGYSSHWGLLAMA